ncbi:MAG: restriction endonuclease subunit S [Archaeoglobaceae archaeon]|nr:restriction endonuclease subunit S [Archaeoglobaceae archaeon]
MAVMSIVKLSELEGAKRIDAEYYKPEYLEIINELKKLHNFRLKEIAYITDGEHGSPIFDESSGILYFSAQHVKEGYIDPTDAKQISKIIDERNKRSRLEVDDVLLSTVGTIGYAGLVTEELLPANIDRHVARIVIRKGLDPAYVTVFLNSRYGKAQTIREATGNVQLNLFIDKIKEIIVPIIPHTEISKLERTALKLIRESKFLYSKAENLLLEELGLKDFTPRYELSYTANLSQTFSVHRIDAEYFQPVYYELINYLKDNFEVRPLKTFILDFQKGIEVGSENYQQEGKLFIRVSNLSIHGFVERDQKYIDDELYQKLRDTYEPKIGDFLLTKDATPGIAYVVKEPVEGIIASGILKLTIDENKIDKEYLALCINSIVGKLQIERDCGGSVIIHWKPEQIKNLQIPVLPYEIQRKIAELVKQSHEARRKAKELLEEAKRKVEEAIENEINNQSAHP